MTALTRNQEGRDRVARANLREASSARGVVDEAQIVVSAISDDAALADIVFQDGGLKETLIAVDTVFEGKRKIGPTTRTRTVLIPDIMMLEQEAALKPAR